MSGKGNAPAASGSTSFKLRRVAAGREKRGTRKSTIWDDIKCSICLEPPHQAILLTCSSNGCRPFVCDTTADMSNCFDDLCLFQSVKLPLDKCIYGFQWPGYNFPAGERMPSCPLCRGDVSGWTVDQPAREAMNDMVRGCHKDSCNFRGNYDDIRCHQSEMGHRKPLDDDDDGNVTESDDD